MIDWIIGVLCCIGIIAAICEKWWHTEGKLRNIGVSQCHAICQNTKHHSFHQVENRLYDHYTTTKKKRGEKLKVITTTPCSYRLTGSPKTVFVIVKLFIVGHTDTADLYSESFRHGRGTEKSQMGTIDGLHLPLASEEYARGVNGNLHLICQCYLHKRLSLNFLLSKYCQIQKFKSHT